MFNDILRRIVEECDGGIGAMLMGYDGIPVDQYDTADTVTDLQMIAVEYANVLKEIRSMAEVLNLGDMEEVAIRTDRLQFLVRVITPEYFVAMTLHHDGNFGKARYLLTRETGNLLAELL